MKISENERFLLIFLLLTILCITIYFNSLHNNLIYDDYHTIVSNVFIKFPGYIPKIFSKDYFILSGEQSYRPLVTLTYFLDYYLWRLNPFGYHFTNLVLHILNSQITFYLIFLITNNLQLSIFVSILFATHPVHTEVLNCASFREDLLVYLFFMLSFIFYIKRRFFFSYIFFFLSLFSKEMAITLPFIILLYIFLFKDNSEISRDRFYICGYFLLLFFYLIVRFKIMNNPDAEPAYYIENSFYKSILTQFSIFLKYFKILLYPFGLSIVHQIKPLKSIFETDFLFSFLLVLSIFFIFFKKNSITKLGILYFFLSLVPVSNIFPLYNPFAERYLYLPSVGFFLIVGDSFEKIYRKNKKISILFFLLIIFSYSLLTFKRNYDWRTSEKLWRAAGIFYPNNWVILEQIGVEYLIKGKPKEAMREFQKALDLNKNDVLLYLNIAVANCFLKNYKKSIEQFSKIIEMKPRKEILSQVYYQRAVAYSKIYEYDKALKDLYKVLEINPYFFDAKFSISIIYNKMKKKKEAIENLKNLIKEAPFYTKAYFFISLIYKEMKEYEEAIDYLNKVSRIDPYNPDIYILLAEIYFEKKEPKKAMEQYRKLSEINPELVEKIKK